MLGRRIIYLLLLYTVFVYNVLYKTYDAYVLLIASVSVPILSLLILIAQRCFIKVCCKKSFIVATRLKNISVGYEVYNPTPFPLVYAELVLPERRNKTRFSVPAGCSVIVGNTVSYEHCTVSLVKLRCVYIYDFFKLFRFRLKNPGVVKVTILPRLFGVDDELQGIGLIDNDGSAGNLKGNDRSEISEIREYRDGDSLKDIHQKLSCRMSRLMVKLYSSEEEQKAAFLYWAEINSSETDEFKDRMLEAMYAIMNALLIRGKDFYGLIPEREDMEKILIRNNGELEAFFMRILNCENHTCYISDGRNMELMIFAPAKSEGLYEFMHEVCDEGKASTLFIPVEQCNHEDEEGVIGVSMQGGGQPCFEPM